MTNRMIQKTFIKIIFVKIALSLLRDMKFLSEGLLGCSCKLSISAYVFIVEIKYGLFLSNLDCSYWDVYVVFGDVMWQQMWLCGLEYSKYLAGHSDLEAQ